MTSKLTVEARMQWVKSLLWIISFIVCSCVDVAWVINTAFLWSGLQNYRIKALSKVQCRIRWDSQLLLIHVNNSRKFGYFTSNGESDLTAAAPPVSRLNRPPSQCRHSALASSRNTTAPIIRLYTSSQAAFPNSFIGEGCIVFVHQLNEWSEEIVLFIVLLLSFKGF